MEHPSPSLTPGKREEKKLSIVEIGSLGNLYKNLSSRDWGFKA